MFYNVARGILWPIAKLYNRFTVVHKTKIPKDGPFIVVANHQSYLDPIYVGLSLPYQLQFMAKAESFKHPILGKILPRLGAFPVNRETNDIKAVKKAIQVLRNGEILGIFPEGTRKSDHEEAIKNGAAYFSLKLGVPILPIGVIGADRVMRKGSSYIYPVKVKVIIGDLIYPTEMNAIKDEQLQEMSERIKQQLKSLITNR